MALNVYDVLKHHIGLGVPGSAKGFMLSGGYTKELQREALGAQDFGGATDLIGQVVSLSRWTQDDFTGGGYQEDWSKDAAMFSSSSSLISEAQSRALMNIPPLVRADAYNPLGLHATYSDNPALPRDILRVGGLIFVVFANGIYRYDITAGTNSWWSAPSGLIGIGGISIVYELKSIRYEPNEKKLYVLSSTSLTYSANNTEPVIFRLKTDLTTPSFNAQWACPDDTTGDAAYGFSLSEGGVVLAVDNKLYLGAVPRHPNSVTGSIKWTEIDRLPGRWIDTVGYAGRTYILCGDSHKTTSLVAFDGSALQPIATFPWNFDGTCIAEYAGRLYVGGHGTDAAGNNDTAELYEVTGASVRLVRSFATPGKRGQTIPLSITSMVVNEGLLWLNCKGTGLIGYDVTSDGLFGGPLYQQGADFDVYKMLSGYGRLWAWGHSDASYATKDGLYRIAKSGDTVTAYTSELVTSDFVFEIAVEKRLSELKVMTRYKACTASVSTDGGSSWTALSGSEVVQGVNRIATFDLSGIAPTEHFRFKIGMAMGTDPTAVGELVAYSCSFAFLDTGKRAWTFIVNGSETIEGRDGTSVAQDVPLTASTLWSWAHDKTPLTFIDVNGDTANVHLQGFRESQPVIGPNISGRPEAFYALTVTEV